MDRKNIPLRPHHGMCIAFFVGQGYSNDFTDHMARTIALLEQDAEVELVTKTDAICGHCPNHQGEFCQTAEKVDRYDAAVLEFCGLRPGQVLPYARFRRLVRERILLPGLRERICQDCQWNGLCR